MVIFTKQGVRVLTSSTSNTNASANAASDNPPAAPPMTARRWSALPKHNQTIEDAHKALVARLAELPTRALPTPKPLVFASTCPEDHDIGLTVPLMRAIANEVMPDVNEALATLGVPDGTAEVVMAVRTGPASTPVSTWPKKETCDAKVIHTSHMHEDMVSGRRIPDIFFFDGLLGFTLLPDALRPVLEALKGRTIVNRHEPENEFFTANGLLEALTPFWEYLEATVKIANPASCTMADIKAQENTARLAKRDLNSLKDLSPEAEWARQAAVEYLIDLGKQKLTATDALPEEFGASDADRWGRQRSSGTSLQGLMRRNGMSDREIMQSGNYDSQCDGF